MKALSGLYLVLLSLFIISCNSKQEGSKAIVYDFYLNFEKEAEELNQMKLSVKKSFSDNGQRDSLTELPNWLNEFQLFIESNVNYKPASDQYELIETMRGDSLLYKLTKSNEEPGVQSIEHYFIDDKLVKVKIEVENSDLLRKSRYELSYLPRSYYSIDAWVEIPFLLERKVSIEAWMQP